MFFYKQSYKHFLLLPIGGGGIPTGGDGIPEVIYKKLYIFNILTTHESDVREKFWVFEIF